MPKIPLPPAESIALDSLAEVARGGMGMVELARATDGRLAGQVLAVKRLHANIAEDPDFVSMFLDETWMTAALKHPNVAQVVAWGNDAKGMFLAIELVQGVSLSRLLKEAQQNQEPFAERTVAYICSQICGALVAAHSLATADGTPLQLVHRDLTPANVLVSFDGMVKVIDFGIAKAEERISHTRTGQLKGKPAYMAPEQQRGDAVDARADIFAFGVVMFELLAGRRPWTSKGAFDVMMEIANDPPPNLGELRRGLNPEFVEIAHKCLEKKPEARFQSAGEIKQRLDAWLSAKGFSADDAQSLAHFVVRNCQPQVLWWKEALRGEHAVKKAPTFKELEEKIDEEREAAARKQAKPAAPLPAAGGKLSRTVPMQAFGGPGSSGMWSPPNLGPPPAPPRPPSNPPASHRAQDAGGLLGVQGPTSVRGLSSTAPMAMTPAIQAMVANYGPGSGSQPSQGPATGAPPSPAAGRRLITGAGTEMLSAGLYQAPGDTGPTSQAVSLGNPGGVPQTPPVSLGNPGGVPQTPPVSLGNPGGVPQTPPVSIGNPVGVPQTPPVSMGNPAGTGNAVAGGADLATAPSSGSPSSAIAPDTAPKKRVAPARKPSRVPLVIAVCVAVAVGVAGGAWLALGPNGMLDLGGQGRAPPKKR